MFEKQNSNAKNVSFGGMNSGNIKNYALFNEPLKKTLNKIENEKAKVFLQAGNGLKEFRSGLEKELKTGLEEKKKTVMEPACKLIPGLAAALELVKASESGETNKMQPMARNGH